MNSHLDSALAPLLWFGLTLVVNAASSQLALAWLELAPARGVRGRLLRPAGAAASMGTGLWAAHSIPAFTGLVAEATLWLMASAAGAMAFGWLGVRHAKLPQWLVAASALALAIVVLQTVGAMASVRTAAIDWHLGHLVTAFVSALAGCMVAFALYFFARRSGPQNLARGRMLAGVILAAGTVVSQHMVISATGLSLAPATAGVLSTFAMLLSGAVMFALHYLLQLQRQAQASRSAVRRELSVQVLHDPLTGLPTRKLFEGTLTQATHKADAAKEWLALLVINLDSFKPVNKSFGHHEGDRVLRGVSERLRALSQPHMTARLNGDEFVMLLGRDPKVEDASELAASVIESIGRPFAVDGREISLGCSIGIAMYPEHGAMSTLISHAQAAMKAAKTAGGASHAFFEPRMVKGAHDDAELLRDLRSAIDKGQLELFYQPKIHAPSGEITGAEALLRWNHPTRGMVSPQVFIPIAERYGVINTIGRWVIDEACRQVHAWREEGLRMRVAINLSVHQLRQADLADRIGSALRKHRVNPELITCELTESSAMDDAQVTMRVLGQLDKVGVHISIDDFGTGHSSLSYLGKLPADELKIDRSFVMDLETNEDARKVALAVINLAKALNLNVVAEGVETEGQDRILREFGCDQLQGFLFAKPMSAKALAVWAMEDDGPRTMAFRESLFKETRFREAVRA